jgi:hypothetical protein
VYFSPLKTLNGRRYSIKKLIQSSQGNNVLDVPPSDIDGFLLRHTYVSSTQLNRLTWNKMCDSSLLNPDRLEVFLSKTKSILKGIHGARYSCFKLRWFSFKRYLCFFNLAK